MSVSGMFLISYNKMYNSQKKLKKPNTSIYIVACGLIITFYPSKLPSFLDSARSRDCVKAGRRNYGVDVSKSVRATFRGSCTRDVWDIMVDR